jgi:hypothetical protein
VTCILITFALHLIVKGMIAMQASRRFCEDRRSGALELLLITPLEPRAILDGQWAALRRQFAWLLVLLTTMNVLLFLLVTAGSFGMPSKVMTIFSMMFLGGAALLFFDFNALGWVGMRTGLDGRRHHRAVMTTLGRVMLGPWAGIFVFNVIGFAGGIDEDAIPGIIITWWLLSIGLSLGLAVRAKRALTGQMRRLASGDAPAAAGAARPGIRAVQSEGPKVA